VQQLVQQQLQWVEQREQWVEKQQRRLAKQQQQLADQKAQLQAQLIEPSKHKKKKSTNLQLVLTGSKLLRVRAHARMHG
jgi:hypothetical protein